MDRLLYSLINYYMKKGNNHEIKKKNSEVQESLKVIEKNYGDYRVDQTSRNAYNLIPLLDLFINLSPGVVYMK